jgi:hypothetical protein
LGAGAKSEIFIGLVGRREIGPLPLHQKENLLCWYHFFQKLYLPNIIAFCPFFFVEIFGRNFAEMSLFCRKNIVTFVSLIDSPR